MKKALTIAEILPEELHPLAAATLFDLGELYLEQGRYDKAELAFGEGLRNYQEILRQAFDSTFSNYAVSLIAFDIARRFERLRALDQAERLYNKGLNWIRHSTDDHAKRVFPIVWVDWQLSLSFKEDFLTPKDSSLMQLRRKSHSWRRAS